MINLSLKLLALAAEETSEKDELTDQIHHCTELMNDGRFSEADELAHRVGLRINYLIENKREGE